MPARTVHHGDAFAWLREARLGERQAVVTSLPDSSEVPRLGFAGWEAWFEETSALLCSSVAERSVAIFFQTDVKREGRWIDKSFLVQLGARRAGSHLIFRKVVCRAPAGTTCFGRPAYAHLLGFSRGLTLTAAQSSPDVLPRLGAMPWARAMGAEACAAVCRFLLDHTACREVIDPFCGVGTMLAVANAFGLDAVGVELSRKRAEQARTLVLSLLERCDGTEKASREAGFFGVLRGCFRILDC